MASVDGQLVAGLDHAAQLVDVRDVQPGIDALAEQVHGQRHQVDVAGALAVAEQRALDSLRAGHKRQLRRRHGAAAVIVRMDAEDEGVAVAEVAMAPLDLVGVDVRRAHLDGGRQVEDDPVLGSGLPDVHHRLADLLGEIQLRAGEAFGRVLENKLGPALVGRQAPDQLGPADGDAGDAIAVQPEDHPALKCRGRVVQVHDHPFCAGQALEGPLDQLVARLGQHLDGDVGRDEVFLDQHADEVEIRLRRGREPDLDLLEAHSHQQLEQPALPGHVHGVDQGLVAVAEVDAAPGRRGGDRTLRPAAVRQVHRRVGPVLADRHLLHGIWRASVEMKDLLGHQTQEVFASALVALAR